MNPRARALARQQKWGVIKRPADVEPRDPMVTPGVMGPKRPHQIQRRVWSRIVARVRGR
jgi:hypothetical protein